MSFLHGSVYSEVLNMDTSVSVVLPHDSRWHRGIIPLEQGITAREKPKTMILLHGLTDNWSAWSNRSKIFYFAECFDIAVVMPEVQRSFYQDMRYGMHYYTYITQELPELVGKMFNVSVAPEDLMIAGQSMGGYGALMCGLSNPERFHAIGAFSSVTDLQHFVFDIPVRKETRGLDRDTIAIFGEEKHIPVQRDLYRLAEQCAANGKCPDIYMACGLQDELCGENVKLDRHLTQLGIAHTFETWDGAHDWDFWDVAMKKFLRGAL